MNKKLRSDQVLFRAGDESDGMYLIRRGELRVYLEQDGKEVALATVAPGGMIGEMALFDKQPRSASVKAITDTEVTLISNADFTKLMKQIPKWFVGLMVTLSTRLRQTNERLQRLENMGTGKPHQDTLRLLSVLILMWHKDGEKEGKEWHLRKSEVVKVMHEMFNEDPEKVKAFFETLVQQNFFSTRLDSYNNVILVTQSRGRLTAFADFLQGFVANNPKLPCLPDAAINILKVLELEAQDSVYDTLTISLDDLIKSGQAHDYETGMWRDAFPTIRNAGDTVRIVNASGGSGLKTTKKEIGTFIRYQAAINAFHRNNLS